jgi:lysophospholipase L1-like esterase
MWWAYFKCVKIIVTSVIAAACVTFSVQAASEYDIPDFIESKTKPQYSYSCMGHFSTISVVGEGSIVACIMGTNTRVASYYAAGGGMNYAISFPYDASFYRLDICQNRVGCIYVEQSDSIFGEAGLYTKFTKNLTSTVKNSVLHYEPNQQSKYTSIQSIIGNAIPIKSVTVSKNGKWAFYELNGYGFIRTNTETLQSKRVIAPGVEYGYGSDPSVELAISNDGKTVAVAGFRMGISVVRVTDTCGDAPNQYMQRYFHGAVTACRYISMPTSHFIQNFSYATRPTFSYDNATLSVDMMSTTAQGKHVTMFLQSNEKDSARYVAIGDSFVSGEGEVDDSYYIGGASNRCHVSSRSYPFLLARSWNIKGANVACSGATTSTARGSVGTTSQTPQLMQLESLLPETVTVGIGGNDAGLIGKLKDCLGIDTCSWASTAENRAKTAKEIQNLYPVLKQFYLDVKSRTLGAVIVVGYPKIITSDAMCSSAAGLMLNQTERVFMNESIQYLNQVIKAAAYNSGAEYADIENSLQGGELCTAHDSAYMNGVRLGDDYPVIELLPMLKIVGAESFHPKPLGHENIAARINELIAIPGILNTYLHEDHTTLAPSPSSYWGGGTNDTAQLAIPFLDKSHIGMSESMTLSFPALTFEPNTPVLLELHSEVKQIGTVSAKPDGSLTYTVSAADLKEGMHSVHAIGESYTGSETNYYDFIAIGDKGSDAILPALTNQGNDGRQHTLPTKVTANAVPTASSNWSTVSSTPLHNVPVSNTPPLALAQTAPNGAMNRMKPEKIILRPEDNNLFKVVIVIGILAIMSGMLYWSVHKKQASNTKT